MSQVKGLFQDLKVDFIAVELDEVGEFQCICCVEVLNPMTYPDV